MEPLRASVFLVAKHTGWTEEALLEMPDATFQSYLRYALRASGHDVDAERGQLVGDAPPADGLPPELEAGLRAAYARATGG